VSEGEKDREGDTDGVGDNDGCVDEGDSEPVCDSVDERLWVSDALLDAVNEALAKVVRDSD
jgi:hypothetical protein